MGRFLLSERYRLELHWNDVKYDQEGICLLVGAYFSGPVLSSAEKINSNDHIMLDFYSQYVEFVTSVYVAKLSWNEVVYEGKSVFLKNAVLEHDSELNSTPQLKRTDYLVIDTKNHEMETHQYYLVYPTFVISCENDLYKFEK